MERQMDRHLENAMRLSRRWLAPDSQQSLAVLVVISMTFSGIACRETQTDNQRSVNSDSEEGSTPFAVRSGEEVPFRDTLVKERLIGQILKDGRLGCTATLINPSVILTASYCFDDFVAPNIAPYMTTPPPTFEFLLRGDSPVKILYKSSNGPVALGHIAKRYDHFGPLFENLLYRDPRPLGYDTPVVTYGFGATESDSGRGTLRRGQQVFRRVYDREHKPGAPDYNISGYPQTEEERIYLQANFHCSRADQCNYKALPDFFDDGTFWLFVRGPTGQVSCNGDGGGPDFLGNQIAAITSRSARFEGRPDNISDAEDCAILQTAADAAIPFYADWIDTEARALQGHQLAWLVPRYVPGPSGVSPGLLLDIIYGGGYHIPIAGNWDGGPDQGPGAVGRYTTIGVFEPQAATFLLRNYNIRGAPDITAFDFGGRRWVPLTGDWDGDGRTNIGVFDPRNATFYLTSRLQASDADVAVVHFGTPGWMPVVGDWDGNGTATIGIYDPRWATWYLKNNNTPGPPDIPVFAYGSTGNLPITGDWDGDGVTTIGVCNANIARCYLSNHNGPSGIDQTVDLGHDGCIPVTGDWDGNGRDSVKCALPEVFWPIPAIPQ